MNSANPCFKTGQTQGKIDESSIPSRPQQPEGEHDAARNRPSCPPLRKDAAAYGRPGQPSWLEGFLRGELDPSLDFMEEARRLWMEIDSEEEFADWLGHDANREEAEKNCSSKNGINTYTKWCVNHTEPKALLWLLEKISEHYLRCNFEKSSKEDLAIWLEALAEDANIEELCIDNLTLDVENAILLKNCLFRKRDLASLYIRNLRLIDGDPWPVIHLAEGIASNIGLENLQLFHCEFNDADWTLMMEMVKDHKTLESLHIARTKLTAENLTTIMDNIQANPQIHELGFRSTDLSAEGSMVIAKSLAGDSALRKLAMIDVNLDPASGCAIAKALTGNSTLIELCLTSCWLDAEFASACRLLLEHNRHLECLDLTDNQIDAQGAVAIANGLQKNHALLEISLNSNCIVEEGALAIAGMLAANNTLTSLDIRGNSFGQNVDQRLFRNLEMNTTLERLLYRNRESHDEIGTKIHHILRRNQEARASRQRDAMLFDRHGAGAPCWLPPEIGGQIMNHLLMRTGSSEDYESTAMAVELALNALANSRQEKTS